MIVVNRKQTPNVTVQLMEPARDIKRIGLGITVDDKEVRRLDPNFDGLERVFALLPRTQGKAIKWERLELKYDRTIPAVPGGPNALDSHELYLNASGLDLKAIQQEGVRFGMDTNVGTMWLQPTGDSFKLSHSGR